MAFWARRVHRVGIGGALTGYMQGELTSDSFAAFASIGLLAIVFVAGVGRIAGRWSQVSCSPPPGCS